MLYAYNDELYDICGSPHNLFLKCTFGCSSGYEMKYFYDLILIFVNSNTYF